MNQVRLDTNWVDYTIVLTYFAVVLGVGFAAKRYIKSSLDYFLSGRSLPAWITGLAFISANLGATEVLGMAANGAQYGVATAIALGGGTTLLLEGTGTAAAAARRRRTVSPLDLRAPR